MYNKKIRSFVLRYFTYTESIRLIRDGRMAVGEEGGIVSSERVTVSRIVLPRSAPFVVVV